MSFSPIYKNFQNLLAENSGVFKLFKKTKNPGMYQAVWQARQAEIDTYRERLSQVENRLNHLSNDAVNENRSMHRRIKDLQAILLGKGETIDHLKERLKEQEDELKQLKKNYNVKCQENEQLTIINNSCDRKIEQLNQEVRGLKKQDDIQAKELSIAHQALIKLDQEYNELGSNYDELTNENNQLCQELEKSRHYAKEFRRINSRMENELHRVNHELERVQGLNIN